MTFQTQVFINSGLGVQGDLIADSPYRGQTFELVSADPTYNVIGATAYTVLSEGKAQAGGTGYFAGILINPKSQVSRGSLSGGTLAPTLTLPNYTVGELLRQGSVLVFITTTAAIGDLVQYNTTTGVLSTIPAVPAGTTPTPSAGCALIPNAYVEKYTVTTAGLAVIHINN